MTNGKKAHGPGLNTAPDDEDEGSLLRGRVNRREQAVHLDAGKIERSADAFQMQQHLSLTQVWSN
ncbi:MAG TPA: hypothetical protein VIH16_11070 [Bellilinea sp.]